MRAHPWFSLMVFGGVALSSSVAMARGPSVDVSTDRGDEAVYQPGEDLEVTARCSDDAYLLVYEIDSEGYVHILFPYRQGSNLIEGRRTYSIPQSGASDELVVEGPVGQCYIVALASIEPLRALPWYLRPRNTQAQELGYYGKSDDEEGVTAEGRIVGDPFVAMERIRRRVLEDPDDEESFGTAYTTYYVHHGVRYPRYLCYDCHRPAHWAWWDGFDPYYSTCSVFSFAVNWNWCWGPSYWFGYVPYYAFVYRSDCPPPYRSFYSRGCWQSSWDGPRRWSTLWGGPLIRHKSSPPVGYVPPTKYDPQRGWRPGSDRIPPGFLADNPRVTGVRRDLPLGRNSRMGNGDPILGGDRRGADGRMRDLRDLRDPAPEPLRGPDGRGTPRLERPRRDDRPLTPPDEPTIDRPPRSGRPSAPGDEPTFVRPPRTGRPRGFDPRVSRSGDPMYLGGPRFVRGRGDDPRASGDPRPTRSEEPLRAPRFMRDRGGDPPDPVYRPRRSERVVERPDYGERPGYVERPFVGREPREGPRIERRGREVSAPPSPGPAHGDVSPHIPRPDMPRFDISRFAAPRFSGRRRN